jgi:hypothetical protein
LRWLGISGVVEVFVKEFSGIGGTSPRDLWKSILTIVSDCFIYLFIYVEVLRFEIRASVL